MLKKLLFVCTLFWMIGTFAVDEHLVIIKNDDDNVTYDLYVEADDFGVAKKLKMYDRKVKDWTYFELENLRSGVVLKESAGRNAIILRSADFEKDRGGHFVIDYLYNGITGRRLSKYVTIDYDGHDWHIFENGKKVNLIDVRVKRVFGQTIGINSINLL